MRHIWIWGVLILLAIAQFGVAADPRADESTDLAPFLNDQTVAVMRIDLQHFNFPTVDKQWLEPLGTTELERAILNVVVRELQRWIDRVKADGASRFYVIATIGSLPEPERLSQIKNDWLAAFVSYSLFVVVPDVKDKAIAELHTAIQRQAKLAWPFGDGRMYPDCRRIHDAAVIGMGTLLDQVAILEPTPRHEFETALAAGGDHPVLFAVAPPPIFARAAAELLPNPLTGMSKPLGSILGQGVRWVGIGVEPNLDTFAARVIVQSADAEAAQNLVDLLQLATSLEKSALEKHGQLALSSLVGKAVSLIPKPDGDRLLQSIDKAGITELRSLVQHVYSEAMDETFRFQSQNNLRQIGEKILEYETKYKHLPEQAIRGKDGKALLSWRVAILPFINRNDLYKEFHLDEPWDSEHNRKLVDRMPEIYRNPDSWPQHPGRTRYLGAVGENLAFAPGKALTIQDFVDGTSKTINVVEVDKDHAVIWTKPEDLEVNLDNPTLGLTDGKRPFLALCVDSSPHVISGGINPKTLRAMFTRNGYESYDLRDE